MTSTRRFQRNLRKQYPGRRNREIRQKLTLREQNPAGAYQLEVVRMQNTLLHAEMQMGDLARWVQEISLDASRPLRDWHQRLEDLRIEFAGEFLGKADPRDKTK